jgi:hypothetical protein
MLRKNLLLVGLSVLLPVVAAEGFLRILEHTRFGAGKLNLLGAATYEHFFFFNGFDSIRKSYAHAAYDPLLGWRNTGRPVINAPRNKDSLTSDGWRGVHEFRKQKDKARRVILVGASFTYGFMVDDSETMGSYLERRLGNDTEVYSMAVPAYSVDQLALVATRIAPDYNPDAVIVAFSADDLKGSCSTFNQGLRKPYFTIRGDSIELHGVPVATPAMVMEEHSRMPAHLWDGVVSKATSSRLISLVGQIALQRQHRDCIEKLNPAIFRYICRNNRPGVRLIIAHVDGDLPPAVEQQLQQLPVEYVSLPPAVRRLSASTGIPPERFKDGHPRPGLNHLYGLALAEILAKSAGGSRTAATEMHSRPQ